MLNFCWTCFLSLIIIQNTFINPFNNGDLKEFNWNHTMKRFNCFPCRHSNCSCNVFTTQHWSQAELSHGCLYVFNPPQKWRASIVYLLAVNQERRSLEYSSNFVNNPIPQRNSNGQLLMYLRRRIRLHIRTVMLLMFHHLQQLQLRTMPCGSQHIYITVVQVNSKYVYQKYVRSGQCMTPFSVAWVDYEYSGMRSPNIHIDTSM